MGAFTSLDEMTIETHLIDILQQLCISGTQTFIETTEQNKKIKLENFFYFVLPTLPSQGRRGERGEGEGLLKPSPPTFSRVISVLKFVFVVTRVSGQRVGKLTEWQS